MPRLSRAFAFLAAGVLAVAAACSKPPAPKVDAAKEQADATARAKERAYGGDAVKALEQAKGLEADLNKKAQESIDKAEK